MGPGQVFIVNALPLERAQALTEQASKSKLMLAIIGAYASVFDQQFVEDSLVEFDPRRPGHCLGQCEVEDLARHGLMKGDRILFCVPRAIRYLRA